MPITRMLRLPQVIEITGLSRDTIYRLGRIDKFPRPRKLSENASAWREDEIRAWIDSRPVESIDVSRLVGSPADEQAVTA